MNETPYLTVDASSSGGHRRQLDRACIAIPRQPLR